MPTSVFDAVVTGVSGQDLICEVPTVIERIVKADQMPDLSVLPLAHVSS